MKAIVTVGVPASGKSTLAARYVAEGWLEINRDEIRKAIFNLDRMSDYKFTRAREKQVTDDVLRQIGVAALVGKNVIISDTNLNHGRREALISTLEESGYDVEVVPCHITFSEAVKRDANRADSVGYHVIGKMWESWIEFLHENDLFPLYIPDETLPNAIVVDIDGTVADHTGIRSPYEWEKVGEDRPRKNVIEVVKSLVNGGNSLIFLSGRDESCRAQTLKWLETHFSGIEFNLYMRPAGNTQPDTEIKAELFFENVAPSYCVKIVFDDRPCMVNLWYDIGIETVFSVADQRIWF